MDMESNVWIFGAGYCARKFLNDKNQTNKKIKGIIDNDYKKVGTNIENIMVYAYETALHEIERNTDKIIITCKKEYAEEIVNQLVKDGLQDRLYGVYQGNDIVTYESMYGLTINSQFGEELGLRNIFDRVDPNYKGFYVDVGAYHPFALSNTKWAYDRGWCGINIDANEESIALFDAFRPRDINLHCGISDIDGIMPFYKYTNSICNSFDNSLMRDLQLEKVTNVPVRKLDDILQEYNVKHIDILDIDAEGFDEKIIKSFAWDVYTPICVLVEVLSGQKSHFWTLDIHKVLIAHGYQFTGLFVKTLIYVQKNWIV